MRRPAVFFDRDNTLIVGNDYLGDPEQVVLVAGAPAAVAKCRAMGFATVVVSNQSGVARGMFTEDAVRACNARMDKLLIEHNPAAVIDRHEYCPFHPDAKVAEYRQDSFLRKPKPGMILAAADAMALDLARSWVIGDAPRDVAAGKAAGCRTILIIDPTLAPSPAALETATVKADFTVTTLVEAIEVVARQTNKVPPPQAEPPPDPLLAITTPIAAPPANSPPASPAASSVVSPRAAIARPQSQTHPANPASSASSAAHRVEIATRRDQPSPPAPPPPIDLSRLEVLGQQILVELKKANEARHDDFSISKLVAGITQVLAVAAIMLAYFLYRTDTASLQSWLLVAVFLQTFTIALLIMSRQK